VRDLNAEWIKSPTARRVFEHWADLRPAWLWSGDGQRLIWRNDAARLFGGRIKKGAFRQAAEPVPIKGQVARLIRLGVLGRSSLSRVQFLSGDKPLSTTCTCTPLLAADGSTALLIVAVDPVDEHLLEGGLGEAAGPGSAAILPDDARYLLVDEDGHVLAGSEGAIEDIAPIVQAQAEGEAPAAASQSIEMEGRRHWLGRFRASSHDDMLLVLLPEDRQSRIAELRADEGLDGLRDSADIAPPPEPEAEPELPMGLPPAEPPAKREEEDIEPAEEPRPLSSLFDRLAGDVVSGPVKVAEAAAVAPVTEGRDIDTAPVEEPPVQTPEPPPVASGYSQDTIAAIIAFAEDGEEEDGTADVLPFVQPERAESPEPQNEPQDETPDEASAGSAEGAAVAATPEADASDAADWDEPEPVTPMVLYRIIGRGLRPKREAEIPAAEPEVAQTMPAEMAVETVSTPAPALAPAAAADKPQAGVEAGMDSKSRHNFDELSRILTDRVGAQTQDTVPEATSTDALRPPPTQPAPEGALISLNAETFILNRLPLGIMVFRDQQVLFANRALVELLGHSSIDGLRAAGLAAIFPDEAAGGGPGPVSRLMRIDGVTLPVNARLQSITWQGRSALMLSASASENRFSHEAAVRAFAELSAAARKEGFVAADRNGVVTQVSAAARTLIGGGEDLVGQPLSALVNEEGRAALRFFLEQPARFAETVRPSLVATSRQPGAEICLFAEGQAGVVSGYFGFVRATRGDSAAPEQPTDTGMLGRISRGVRRPLNTIVGFADLIRSSAFGEIENQRYVEYARDIKTAGQEIALLVDELDEFSRLKDGRYPARPADIDLGALLDSCLVRVKAQAGQRRVLVRNGVSERLPHLRADRASLGQAVLNLLASAVAQSPAGSTVILSAQPDDDGSLAIQIRDSSQAVADPSERFVVFRDGTDKDGQPLEPVPSSVGLALTRSLLAVNACRLAVAPTPGSGMLFSITVPAELITQP
jgi:signal transduction histidine kinase